MEDRIILLHSSQTDVKKSELLRLTFSSKDAKITIRPWILVSYSVHFKRMLPRIQGWVLIQFLQSVLGTSKKSFQSAPACIKMCW